MLVSQNKKKKKKRKTSEFLPLFNPWSYKASINNVNQTKPKREKKEKEQAPTRVSEILNLGNQERSKHSNLVVLCCFPAWPAGFVEDSMRV